MSGRWLPPAAGWFETRTSPSFRSSPCISIWYRTALLIAPRWTGTWGALATSFPCSSKMAQEKSRRSLMLVEIAVRCRVRPICSPTDINRLLKIESWTGSNSVLIFFLVTEPTWIWMSPKSVMLAVHCGSMMIVDVCWISIEGPSNSCPAPSFSIKNTGVSSQPSSK